MFRIFLTTLLFTFISTAQAQIGISTTNPQGALDVSSNDNGILIPRVTLTSATDVTTVVSPNAGTLVESTLVYNTGANPGLSEAGFYFWNGSQWMKLVDSSSSVAVGKERITGTGNIVITTGFRPKRVTFTAYANVENYTLNAVGSSSNNKDNSFGYMKGYANDNAGTIEQQVINGGGSGESINNISRYASASHCVGMRYANQDAVQLGLTTARVTAFSDTGFTLNVDSYLANEPLVIIYEAHRY